MALRDAVAAHLGYVPWDPLAPRLVIVAVGREGGTLRARVELREPDGRIGGVRELASVDGDCGELAAAVELAIAIAIDPLGVARAGSQGAAARRPRTAPTARGPGPGPPREVAPAARAEDLRRTRLAVSVGGLLCVGTEPSSLAGGLTLQARLQRRRTSLGLEGRVDLPARRAVPGGEISASLLLGGLVGCYHLGPALGCGLLELGALRAAGHDLPAAASATLFYGAGGARVGLELPLAAVLALRLHGDLLATFSHITLRETGTQRAIWSTPPLSGALGVAAVAVIP